MFLGNIILDTLYFIDNDYNIIHYDYNYGPHIFGY